MCILCTLFSSLTELKLTLWLTYSRLQNSPFFSWLFPSLWSLIWLLLKLVSRYLHTGPNFWILLLFLWSSTCSTLIGLLNWLQLYKVSICRVAMIGCYPIHQMNTYSCIRIHTQSRVMHARIFQFMTMRSWSVFYAQ